MVYNGIALNETLENGRKSCLINVHPNKILFSWDNYELEFPFQGLQVESGGAGNILVYFKHPDYPGWTIYSGDLGLLKDPILSQHHAAKKSLSRINSSHSKLIGLLVSFILLIVLFFASLFIFRKQLVFAVAKTIPTGWEQQAGEAIFEGIVLDKKLVEDSILTLEVNKLGQQLTHVVEDTSVRFKFHIVEDSTINAFALPGGNVVIHSGLILKADSVEEVLGVLGHEIAHVTERHHARGIITRMGLTFIVSSFFISDTGLGELIINTGSTLQSLKYDREYEIEADEKGWEYLVKAGLNPQGMITFFQKLEAESGDVEIPDILSTHPATSERIERMKKKWEEEDQKEFAKPDFNFEAFQNKLKEKINN